MSRTCGHVPLNVSMQTEHLKVTDVCVSGQLVEYIFLIILRACVFVCKVYSVGFLFVFFIFTSCREEVTFFGYLFYFVFYVFNTIIVLVCFSLNSERKQDL